MLIIMIIMIIVQTQFISRKDYKHQLPQLALLDIVSNTNYITESNIEKYSMKNG